jgi:hypothetical protein
MCDKCGTYKGVKVIDMTAIVAKKTAKKQKTQKATAK